MTSFFIVLQQVGLFAVYMTIGVISVKSGVLNKDGLGVLSRFVTRVALPLMVFTNIVGETTRSDFRSSFPIFPLSVLLYGILFLTGLTLRKTFRMRGDRGRVYQACSMFGNAGFIGIPIITALFPERGMLYIALYTIPDMLVLWTEGVILTSPESSMKNISAGQLVRKMLNPTVIATLLSVTFVLLNIKLPGVLGTALTRAGSVATPLALIYLGGIFCYIDMPTYLKKKEIYGTILFKMVVIPILVFLLFSHIPGVSHEIVLTMSMIACMPTMTTITMLAQTQGSDGDYAAGMIVMTTIAALATLPLVSLIIG